MKPETILNAVYRMCETGKFQPADLAFHDGYNAALEGVSSLIMAGKKEIEKEKANG